MEKVKEKKQEKQKKKWKRLGGGTTCDDGCCRCIVCDAPLTKSTGYMNTDMCGPCATGEADTINEFGTY